MFANKHASELQFTKQNLADVETMHTNKLADEDEII